MWSGVCAALACFRLCADNSQLAAHRADHARYPQNTVEGIRSAVRQGVGMVEIDVRVCKTGELLVICEPDLALTTDGTGMVTDVTFDYVRSLSVCERSKYGEAFVGKFRIPTLEEALDAIPVGGPYVNLHCGENVCAGAARLVKKKGLLAQAFVSALDPGIAAARKAVPEIMACNMHRPAKPSLKWTHEDHMRYVRSTIELKCQFMQPIGVENVPPADVVKFAHENGIKVSYFKCDDPKRRAEIFAETDVDFIFTDRVPGACTGSEFAFNGSMEEFRERNPYGWRPVNGFKFVRGAGRDGSVGAELLQHNVKKPAYIESKFPILGGRSYEVSVWIRTKDVKGNKSGAGLYAEVKDADGRYIEGAQIYPRGSLGTKGWTRYSGVVNAPHAATTMSAGVMLFAGVEGQAWVDDFSCVMLPQIPVQQVVTDAYRNQTAGKRVLLSAVLGLEKVSGIKARFELVDGRGKVVRTVVPKNLSINHASAFADLKGIPAGCYDVNFILTDERGKALGTASCPLEVLNKLPDRKVTLDDRQRTVVDGRAFFPLGMYSYDIKEEDVKMYAEAPFNTIMSYRVPTDEQMDTFAKHGIKAIVGFSNYFYGLAKKFKTQDEEYDFFTNSINRLKGHSALLAWYLHDEIPLEYLPRLKVRQRLAHELDPDHPTWGVVCLPYNTGLLLETFDICGNDPYPVYHDGKKDLYKSWHWPQLSRQLTCRSRGVWQVPQAFSWANYQKLAEVKGEARNPTFDEMRTMAYQQIAGGANGLLFYSFHDVHTTMRKDPKVGAVLWDDIRRLAHEIRERETIWLSDETDSVRVMGLNQAKVSARAFRQGKADYILVAAGEKDGCTVEIEFLSGSRTVRSLFGPPVAPKGARACQLKLPTYGVALVMAE